MIGGLRARARAGPRVAPTASAISASSVGELVVALDRDGRAVERGDGPLGVGERDERMERADLGARRPSPARGPRRRARRSCGPSPGRCTCRSSPASGAIASSGTARMISSTSSTSGLRLGERRGARRRGSGTARAGPGRGWRRRGSASRPGSARRRARSRRPRPDDPDDRRLARRPRAGGDARARRRGPTRRRGRCVARRRSDRGRCPAASIAACVSPRRLAPRGSSPSGAAPQAFIGEPSRAACRARRGTLHPSSVAEPARRTRVTDPDPFGARAASAPACPTSTGSTRSADRIDLATRAGHAQDPAREPPPPRRRRDRPSGRRRDARGVAARRRRPRPRSRSCRRG